MTKMAAGVAVVGLVLAGCGGEDGSDDSASGDGSAEETAEDATAESGDESGEESDEESGDTETISISEGKGGGTELFEAMTAAYEEAGSYHFEMEMDAEGVQLSGEGAVEFGGDETNMTMTMQVPQAGETLMRVVDGQFFMSAPSDAGLPTEASWLTIDTEADGPMGFGDIAGDVSSSAEIQADFAQNSELIAVEEGGTDTIDGVEVTEYMLTVDAEDAAEFMESSGEVTDGAAAEEGLSYSLWVDGDGLPRRMSGDVGGGTMDMRFFDFGESVDVEAPPEDEVTDLSSLMDQ